MFAAQITQSQNINKNCAEFKREKHNALISLLTEIQSAPDLNESDIIRLLAYCRTCLNDSQFTYKQISLFGLLSSRSEDLVKQIIGIVFNQTIFLFIQKLFSQAADNAFLIKIIQDLKSDVERKDYSSALKWLKTIIDSGELAAHPQATFFIQTWLQRRAALKIDLPEPRQTYRAVRYPLVEVNPDQKSYNLDELKSYMMQQPEGTLISFTYAVDMCRNVFFSVGANSSFHINICNGLPVYGAGEVYLKRTGDSIELITLNNKSGLYIPRTNYFPAMKEWFHSLGVIVRNTKLEDERNNIIRATVQARTMMR